MSARESERCILARLSLLALDLLCLELVEDGERLVDLAIEGLLGADERQEFDVVHLEQHTGDLASEIGVLTVRGCQYTQKNLNEGKTYEMICM